MSIAYEIEQSWRRDGCSELCWQRFVQIERGRRLQILTYHDLDSHRRAWEQERDPEIVSTGPLSFDRLRHLVQVDGRDVYLTPIETRIMFALADHIGALQSLDEILVAVWGPSYRGEHNLMRTNMARLRERLGPAGNMIVTHVGKGIELRRIPPCRSDRVSAVIPPVLHVNPELSVSMPLGQRQRQVLQTLQSAPGRRMAVADLLVAIWGDSSPKARRILDVSTSALQRRGYAIHLDHAQGSIWLDNEGTAS